MTTQAIPGYSSKDLTSPAPVPTQSIEVSRYYKQLTQTHVKALHHMMGIYKDGHSYAAPPSHLENQATA